MESLPQTVNIYRMESGYVPFVEWLDGLKDRRAKQVIDVRLTRISGGNFGNIRFLQDGLYEAKINYGPGYRLYFGREGQTIVVLLCGGDKSSQRNDIEAALRYWKDYRGATDG